MPRHVHEDASDVQTDISSERREWLMWTELSKFMSQYRFTTIWFDVLDDADVYAKRYIRIS